jgi:hypothetical protein
MTPEQIETYAAIGGGVVAVLGGPAAVKAGLAWWAGYRERRARAREALAEREVERDEARESARLEAERVRIMAHENSEEREASVAQRALDIVKTLSGQVEDMRKDCDEKTARAIAESERRCEERMEQRLSERADSTQRVRTIVMDVLRSTPVPPKGET